MFAADGTPAPTARSSSQGHETGTIYKLSLSNSLVSELHVHTPNGSSEESFPASTRRALQRSSICRSPTADRRTLQPRAESLGRKRTPVHPLTATTETPYSYF